MWDGCEINDHLLNGIMVWRLMIYRNDNYQLSDKCNEKLQELSFFFVYSYIYCFFQELIDQQERQDKNTENNVVSWQKPVSTLYIHFSVKPRADT